MYRVDFIDKANYGFVHHSLSLSDGLDNIKISSDKIAGADYFAKEPKRIEFNCFKDDWIEANILSGTNEHDRYISHYEVRFYENNSLIFHGIIDTSFCSYDAKTEIVRFTCYDKLRLFVKFSDLKMLYALMGGFHSGYCFGYLAQGIENAIDIEVPVYWNNTYSNLVLESTDLEILTFEWKKLLKPFRNWSIYSVMVGFKTINMITRLQVCIKAYQFEDDTQRAKIYGKTWDFYNTICPLLNGDIEVDEETDWFSNQYALQVIIDEISANYNTSLDSNFSVNGNNYIVSISTNDLEYDTASEEKTVTFTGNPIPANIYPKGFYDQQNEQKEKLKVLKAALLLHNLTITSDVYGNLWLKNKNDTSNTVVAITSSDIVEFKRKRINRTKPNTSILDVLMGDTTVLKQILVDYYGAFLSQIWEIETTIDNLSKYSISLFDKIQISDQQYRVTEIQRDPQNDEYKIKAWEI